MKRLRHWYIERSTPPHITSKILKSDIITVGGIFHLLHLPLQGLCPFQRTTFCIISPTTQDYLCVSPIHIPKNTQHKYFSERSWLCHISKELHAIWTWYLQLYLADTEDTLTTPAISRGFSNKYKWCVWLSPASCYFLIQACSKNASDNFLGIQFWRNSG